MSTTRQRTSTASGAASSANAASVVVRVQSIESITQIRGAFERYPLAPDESVEVGLSRPFTRAELHDGNRAAVLVNQSAELTLAPTGDAPRKPTEPQSESAPERRLLMKIEATYIAVYQLSDGPPIAPDDLAAFAQANGVFNVTPFWREFVSNALARAGMPPLMVPVMKLGQSAPPPVETRAKRGD